MPTDIVSSNLNQRSYLQVHLKSPLLREAQLVLEHPETGKIFQSFMYFYLFLCIYREQFIYLLKIHSVLPHQFHQFYPNINKKMISVNQVLHFRYIPYMHISDTFIKATRSRNYTFIININTQYKLYILNKAFEIQKS